MLSVAIKTSAREVMHGRPWSRVCGATNFLQRQFSSNGPGGFSSDHLLDGKVAIITGGASGIGKETARVFAKQGARVVIADIQPAAADQVEGLLHELGSSVEYCQCDVTKEEEVVQVWEKAYALDDRLDIVFNNAGILGAWGPIDSLNVEDFDKVLSVNLRAVFLGIKHAARLMKPRKQGSIISTSSTAGVIAGLGPHLYTTSKIGIVGLTKSAASELDQHGIRVNCLSPSGTPTPLVAEMLEKMHKKHMSLEAVEELLSQKSPYPSSRYLTTKDVANAALYLASDVGGLVSGHNLVLDAGVTSYMTPQGLAWF